MPSTDRRYPIAHAMLQGALTDLTSADRDTVVEARRWLLEDAACVTCCELLGLEVEDIRHGVRARLDGRGPQLAEHQGRG